MNSITGKQLKMLFNIYYWQTAVLIARNGLARMYRNSFLGILWTLFQPLTMVIVYGVMMPMIMRSTAKDYVLYIVISLPIWGFFSASLIGSSQSILSNGETLKRCMISSSVFPIADVLRNFYTFCISFSTIYTVSLLIGIAHFSFTIFLFPIFFIPVLIIIGSIAISIAFIAPYIRDIGDLTSVLMTVMFWLTPVIYQSSILPQNAKASMQFNPFYIMIHPLQMIAYENIIPDSSAILNLFILVTIAVSIGFSVFKFCRRNYVYYL